MIIVVLIMYYILCKGYLLVKTSCHIHANVLQLDKIIMIAWWMFYMFSPESTNFHSYNPGPWPKLHQKGPHFNLYTVRSCYDDNEDLS